MEKYESMSLHRLLFDLGSRLGSLEGYLYSEQKVEKKYLKNWLQNVDREFKGVPSEARREIEPDYLELLRKVHALLSRAYGDQDEDTVKIAAMISDLKR